MAVWNVSDETKKLLNTLKHELEAEDQDEVVVKLIRFYRAEYVKADSLDREMREGLDKILELKKAGETEK